MFILDSHEIKSAMFANGHKDNVDKRIGHINLYKLKGMQLRGVVIRQPTFTEKEIVGMFEACQFGKQH